MDSKTRISQDRPCHDFVAELEASMALAAAGILRARPATAEFFTNRPNVAGTATSYVLQEIEDAALMTAMGILQEHGGMQVGTLIFDGFLVRGDVPAAALNKVADAMDRDPFTRGMRMVVKG